MVPEAIRQSVQTMQQQGQSLRAISRLLKLSRNAVRRILRSAKADPVAASPSTCPAHLRAALQRSFQSAGGNAVRALELLAEQHEAPIPYSTLTRWIREEQLRPAPVRSGEYHFAPGEEMQHDTSPHKVLIGGRLVTAQCASLVLAYSRRLFFQYLPRYTRFDAKQFLLQAACFMDGVCPRCVIDNTSVIVVSGSGPDALFAPEIVAFARTLGFGFMAHRINDSDRKGRIERPFHWIENSFLPARTFTDFEDLNGQALQWCRNTANAKVKRVLGMAPEAAYLIEKPYLVRLPTALPPVYEVYERVVDLHGFVSVDTNRYSVPQRWIGKQVTVYKYPQQIQIHYRHATVATHPRLIGQRDGRNVLAQHHGPRIARPTRSQVSAQQLLNESAQAVTDYAAALQRHNRRSSLRVLHRLVDLKRTYPSEPFVAAVAEALEYGMFDLSRLETMILRRVAGDFFALIDESEHDDDP